MKWVQKGSGCAAGEVGVEQFEQAVMRSMMGVEKRSGRMNTQDSRNTALHEAGHAVVSTAVSRLIARYPTVEKLSIVPRANGALGCAPPDAEGMGTVPFVLPPHPFQTCLVRACGALHAALRFAPHVWQS